MITNHILECKNCNVTVEIQYEAKQAEQGYVPGTSLTYRIPGEIEIIDVQVLEIEGFDANGDMEYYYDYHDLEVAGWLKWADDAAYQLVMDEMDNGLSELLWERA